MGEGEAGVFMAYFLQQLINGIALGSIYGLIAIGYTMVYGIIGMINFAHGDIFMVGAFIALIALTNALLGLPFELYNDWAGLEEYGYLVAGTIGLVCAAIFEARGAEAERCARAQGLGMQLVNIMRDVGEDAGAGRIYLPRELLDEHAEHRQCRETLDYVTTVKVSGFPAIRRFGCAGSAVGRSVLTHILPPPGRHVRA